MEGLKAALEITKQVITLASAIVALTVTFLEKIEQPQAGAARYVPSTLKIAWICFGVATILAMWTLMALTGTLSALDRDSRKLQLSDSQLEATQNLADGANIRVPAVLMLLVFASGIILVIASGFSV